MASAKYMTQTYLPEESAEVAAVHDFLEAYSAKFHDLPRQSCLLVGPDKHDQVEIPEQLHSILVQAVESLLEGRAVTIAPQSTTLTTQQAADLLGVSRPTIVKLIDGGELPAERTTHRRRVLLRDLLDYKQRRKEQQYAALEELVVENEQDVVENLEELKKARKVISKRHT